MRFNNEKLEQLKKALQLKLKAKAFVEDFVQPFTEIRTALKDQGIDYILCGWNIPDETTLPYLSEILTASEFSSLVVHTDEADEVKRLDKLFDLYPSVHALRYVPPIPEILGNAGLKKAIDNLCLADQPVYVYYLRYAPVLKLPLYGLLSVEEDELFNFWHGDVVIFPKDLSWLIAYSLEEDWYAGRFSETEIKKDTL